jgi:sulfur carrier protein
MARGIAMIIKARRIAQKQDADEITAADLLTSRRLESPDMVSVRLNASLMDMGNYSARAIMENNQVDFLCFMGGGCR